MLLAEPAVPGAARAGSGHVTGADDDGALDASALRRATADAVARLLADGTEPRPELAALSSRTRVDGVEVFDGDIKLAGERFEGLVNVHCNIGYDGGGGIAFETSQTFPGRFEVTVRPDGPTVTRLSVDTASLYA